MRSHRRHLKRLRAATLISAAYRPCFASAELVRPVYLLSRGAKQRDGTTGNSSRGGSDIVKTDENTTFDGARIGAAFVRGG